MFSRSKRLKVGLVATVASIVLAVSASSALATTNYYGNDGTGHAECSVSTYIHVQGGLQGAGNIWCAHRHEYSQANIMLKKSGSVVYQTGWITYWNSFGWGNQWKYTYQAHGCGYYQAVVSFNIAGIGSSYVTTGTPRYLCG